MKLLLKFLNCVKNKVSIVYYIKTWHKSVFNIHHFLVQQITAIRSKQKSEKHFHRENSWTCKSAVSHAERFSGSHWGEMKSYREQDMKSNWKPGELDKENNTLPHFKCASEKSSNYRQNKMFLNVSKKSEMISLKGMSHISYYVS